jgi:putative phosphoesterase
MKYGFISDTHDNLHNTRKACEELIERGIVLAFHLGDIGSSSVLKTMKKFPIKWDIVSGNNDGNIGSFILLQDERMQLHYRGWRTVELDNGINIFITHYPELAEHAVQTGNYTAVFYGHTHLAKTQYITIQNGRDVILANPGEIHGTRTGTPSFGIWDSLKNSFEIIYLEDFRTVR